MHRLRLLLLPLLALLALGSVAASPASAKSSIRVGIGDQSAAMFDQPAYKPLGLKMTRYFFPWNGMDNAYEKQRATDYVNRANASGVSVLLHLSTDNFASKKAKLPSKAAYTSQLKKLVPYFRGLGVKEWGVWNEANHSSQPTYKDAKRAGQFFTAMYTVVGSKDNIVALDVLDQGGVDKYEKTFYGSLSPTFRKRAKIIGIHNYGDVNYKRTTYTTKMIKTARTYNKSAKFWFTETGGLVNWKSFKCSTDRAASRTSNVLNLAKKFQSQGVQRVYFYNWFGADCKSGAFDAGFAKNDGTVRKSLAAFQSGLKNFSK
jgi:hypothetical protein